MKLLKIMCLFLCAALLLCGCAPASDPADDPADSTGSSESTGSAESTGTTESTGTSKPDVLTKEPPKTLKVLAIGNSFSIDGMQYLYQIAEEAGVEEIVLGNLFYGGCSLSEHLNFASDDSPSYDYYKNTEGTWELNAKYKMSDAILDEEWDYITMQQESGASGRSDTYKGVLSQLIDYVQSKNSTATLAWHMTWAYEAGCTHSEFPLYDNDQMKMYNGIVGCVNEHILTEPRFSFVIPSGTAIQNARTSFIGDTLTRDGFHLDKQIGRYIASLTWFAAITNSSVESIKFNPAKLKITDDMLKVAREAATNAVNNPYAVTQSAFTEGVKP